MTRRQGAEGFVSGKKARKQDKIERKQNTRNERKAVIIACEDSVSAPLYFRALFAELRTNHSITASSLVIAQHQHTDPCGVLQDLLDHPDYEDFDYQWIVIDRDEERTNSGGHTVENFNQALTIAKSKMIKIAYANPCFEFWYLLHFEYRNTAIDRNELCRQLQKTIGYKKNELPKLSSNQQETAINNAKKLLASWVESQGKVTPATDNPSTTVHELVELLNGFKTLNRPAPL